jgi:hypothetical protein
MPRIGPHTGAGFDRYGFAGEHGLVEQDFSLGEAHIRGDHRAEGKLHYIAWDQLGRLYRLPSALAVFRLRLSSYLVGCEIGILAGFAPLADHRLSAVGSVVNPRRQATRR